MMQSDRDDMILVELLEDEVVSKEQYAKLLEYIRKLKDQAYSEGYDDGWQSGLDQGRFNWGP